MKEYCKAESLAHAYELNQKPQNKLLAGLLWLKMGRKAIHTGIDISGLGFDSIEETEDYIKIGAMATLRQVETSDILKSVFDGILPKAVSHIVGVQFRNSATMGGSVFSRFGFSDVITALLCLDSYVQLYKGGVRPLAEFLTLPYDRDILLCIVIKKDNRRAVYQCQRLSKTDFPILAVAVATSGDQYYTAIGARPQKACLLTGATEEILLQKMEETVVFGSNLRGSAAYRRHLAEVFINRGLKQLKEEA